MEKQPPSEMLDAAVQSNYDLLVLYLPDRKAEVVEDVINRVKQKNIPLILMNIDPGVVSKVSKLYNKVAFATPDSKMAGIVQGKIIVDLWNNNKSLIDKNGDDILQYVLLKGPSDDPQVVDRTKYAISTINEAGIKTQELAAVNANWLEDLAKSSIDNLFLKLYGKVEAIISNNDAMAIGAIKSLQNFEYNKGDKTKEIAVVGIDGLPEARELVDKGFMTGTVIQESRVGAEFLYTVGMNLINNLEPTENTDYKTVEGEILIPYPYEPYVKKA
jgi:methyl-galactoside transport system substrate-binding protein